MKIPFDEVSICAVRSGGKGGQHVNKVATKVQLRWPVGESAVFSPEEKERIRQALTNRLNDDDEIMIEADAERSQAENRRIAIGRLHALVARALAPRNIRRSTKPTRAGKERRLLEKRKASEKKRVRKIKNSEL